MVMMEEGRCVAYLIQGKLTPFCFTEDIMTENFITKIRIDERKAKALISAEAIENTSASILNNGYMMRCLRERALEVCNRER
jgi:hypothetical protein